VALLVVAPLLFGGCANRNLAIQTARHLHADIVLYEVMLNERIAQEKSMYDKRLGVIHSEENELLINNLEQFRRHRSAELASAMSADPEREVQLGNLIHFLNDSVQAEYSLYRRLQEKEASAASEFQAALAKHERHRQELAHVEEQVAALSTRSKLRDNNKLLMASVDDLLEELERDTRNKAAEKRKGLRLHRTKITLKASTPSTLSNSSVPSMPSTPPTPR
jgi:hypothetical protein